MIQREELNGRINGLKFGRNQISVSYLFFADDSLVFLEENKDECSCFLEVSKIC